MPKKEDLINKLFRKPYPKNFTIRELDCLMKKCDCEKGSGGRGSGVKYIHKHTKRVLQFDQPHPGNELYRYQIEMIKEFLKGIKEV